MNQLLGEIKEYAGDILPFGFMFCNGAILQIEDHPVLFSLIGNKFGGDGLTTFGLPDKRGRCGIGAGQGENLTSRALGERAGSESITLDIAEIPAHSHQMKANSATAISNNPNASNLGAPESNIYNRDVPNLSMSNAAIGETGSGNAHSNMQPSLVVNYIIAVKGIYPQIDGE
jgi:microcystin-dependent protein